MSDLAGKIRDRLDTSSVELSPAALAFFGIEPGPATVAQMRTAIRRILEVHPASPHACPAVEDGELRVAHRAVCPSLLLIAKALGIEVDGG
jgi:hypothetical protein